MLPWIRVALKVLKVVAVVGGVTVAGAAIAGASAEAEEKAAEERKRQEEAEEKAAKERKRQEEADRLKRESISSYKRVFIFDTNFLIDYYNASLFRKLFKDENPNIERVIPNEVLKELDKCKTGDGEREFKCREVNRLLVELSEKGLFQVVGENGRGDDQILKTIEKFAKSDEGKNADKIYVCTGDNIFKTRINGLKIAKLQVVSSPFDYTLEY